MQDSLGGNSKTMIIANVSPSVWLVHLLYTCLRLLPRLILKVFLWNVLTVFALSSCAAETLNTLKFAQRAKLIQNNVSFSLNVMKYDMNKTLVVMDSES